MRHLVATGVVLALVGVVTGCATDAPDKSFERVQGVLNGRSETLPEWPLEPEAEGAVQNRVNELLHQPLTSQTVTEIALLNNRRLRAAFARVGIASADLVEAGLLENPSLTSAFGFPEGSPSITELDFGLTFNILRLLMTPARKQIANLQLDSTIFDVADEVLKTRSHAQMAFYELQAAEHLTSVLKEIMSAAESSAEFARKLHDAGNLSDLALANEQVLYEETLLAYGRSVADAASLRERLNVALSLWGDETDWSIVDRLPEVPAREPDVANIESLAVRQRFDLAATAKEVESLYFALGLQRRWRYVLTADAGFIASRDTDGQWVFGPLLSIEIPIFNQRQADIARLEAALQGAESRLDAIAIETRADVRRLLDRLYALRYEAEQYKSRVLPLRQRVTALTQEQYNFMLMDTFDLLAAKRAEIASYRDYLDTVREYWITRAELERAVGGQLPFSDGADPLDVHPPASTGSHQSAKTEHNHTIGGD